MAVVTRTERNRHAVGLAGPGALALAEGAALGQPFHVMVVAVLRRAHFGFESQHLRPVLAERAVHLGVTPHHLSHPLLEGVDHPGVIPQVGHRQEAHLGMVGRHPLGVLPDPAHQHPGEQEVREHQDAAIPQAHHMAQTGLHQGEGDAGVKGLSPAEAQALHQHARHLGDVGIGVGIGGSPTHHHQQGVVQGHGRPAGGPVIPIGLRQGFADPRAGGLNHLQIHAELAAVLHLQAGLAGIGIEHGGDVVLGMPGGKQHRRHRQDVTDPPLPQRLQAITQDRPGEFQIAVLHRQGIEAAPQRLGQAGELLHRQAVAAAVAAHQNAEKPMGSAQRHGEGLRTHDQEQPSRPYCAPREGSGLAGARREWVHGPTPSTVRAAAATAGGPAPA